MAQRDKRTVAELLKLRSDTMKERKKTEFDTYVQVVAEMFEEKHPEHTFKPAMITHLEPRWKKLTEKEKESYRRLMVIENKAIDAEIKKIDDIIIAKRPGHRMYVDFPITVPNPEKEKKLEDKMCFSPIFWYQLATHYDNTTKRGAEYQWRDNVPKMQLDAIDGWPSLSDSLKRRYIKTAKEEYANYTGSSDGDELVDKILLRKLQRRQEELAQVNEGSAAESLDSLQIDQLEPIT